MRGLNRWCLGLVLALSFCVSHSVADEFSVVFEGDDGPGKGKHIVFIASDHEYRGEESLPALARIMAKHYGFKCTVIFGIDPKDGTLLAGSSHLGGLEVLKDADLMVIFMRFIHMPDDQMQHFEDYIERGGPVIGLRTSTHAFKIDDKNSKFYKYTYNYAGKDYRKGFGRQVLGETWVTHYGDNHRQSSILAIEQDNRRHPVLKGVSDMHTQAGGYTADPIAGSVILARGIILNGMEKDAGVDTSKNLLPVVWTRERESESGKVARIFTTTQGASEDIVNDGFRRLLVNAHLWCLGMDKQITADNPIDFVGPYHPSTFNFDGHKRGVKPADLAGWDSPIMDPAKPIK